MRVDFKVKAFLYLICNNHKLHLYSQFLIFAAKLKVQADR